MAKVAQTLVSATPRLVSALVFALAAQSPQQLFDRAVAALAAKDYAAAEQGFHAVLKFAPTHIGALGNLGVVYSRTHRYDAAVAVYQRALKSAPRDPGLLLNLGLAYLKQERYDRALPVFEKLAATQPSNAQAQELLATCYVFSGNAAAAVAPLESLRTPSARYLLGLAYTRLKQPEKAKVALAEMMNAATPAQASFLLGKTLYDEGRFEEAAAAFRKTLESDPSFPQVHLELGRVYVSLRRNADAERELHLALQADPHDADAHYFLGGLLAQDGRSAEASPHLEEASRLHPDAWGAYYYLARIHLADGNAARAVQRLEKAAALKPDEPAVFYQLARALQLAGRAAEAKQALQKMQALRSRKLETEIEIVSGSRR
ncbi:MAG: tetratricopeptide repeat protein [Bryobacteraceae bacterium]